LGDIPKDELLEKGLLGADEPKIPSYRCPKCNQPMICTQFSYRPSWKVIMERIQGGNYGEWYEPPEWDGHTAWHDHAEWQEHAAWYES